MLEVHYSSQYNSNCVFIDWSKIPQITAELGDCTLEIYSEWVICRSYPGATGIYKRKKP